MEKSLQFKKIVAVLMIFILMVQQYGCTTSRYISTADIPDSPKFMYKIHCRKFTYLLDNTLNSNGIVTGKIIDSGSSAYTGNVIHLYPYSDSLVKISPEMILTVPLSGISQVRMTKFSTWKIIAILGGIALFIAAGSGVPGPGVGL